MASTAAINNLGPTAHNPRGNLWFNDDTTFGHKLLMKMGWQKGKGLGKNEDGIKENLKVKFRSTNSGLGFKDDAYANVMKNEYESLLKNLKPQYSSQITSNVPNETEKPPKSKIVKNRLRYPKLFFGKDVTKYSEKDMKSIFICSQQIGEAQEKEDYKVISDKKEPESNLSKSEKNIKSDLSISEYFAMKMKKKISNVSNKSTTVHSDQQMSFESNKPITGNLMNDVKPSSKRKRKSSEMSTDGEYTSELNLHSSIMQSKDIKTESVVEFTESTCNKSPSKKKKRKSGMISSLNEVNSYINGNDHKSVDENHENISALSLEISLGRSSKNNEKSHMAQNEYNVANTTEMICENFENVELSISNKKKKKKKKQRHSSPSAVEHSFKNPTFEKEKLLENPETTHGFSFSNISDNELLNGNTNCLEKKNKHKKKKLKQTLKSCLKTKKGSYSMKNVSFNENVSYRIIDSDIDCVEDLAEEQSLDINQLFANVESAARACLNSVNVSTCNKSCRITQEDINSTKQVMSDECDAATNNHTTTTNEAESDQISSYLYRDYTQDVADEKSNQVSALSSLPSSNSPYYNFWIESQRLALKMNSYKRMLKNVATHDVLRTTNLLSIQGYGNWGFK